VIAGFVSFITIADPGFGAMVTRYGARGRVSGDRLVAARVCTLGTLVWFGAGTFFPLVWLATPTLVHYAKIDEAHRSVMVAYVYWSYLLVFIGSAVSTLSSRLRSATSGSSR
jgi:O-antigen/teichoic acid export membrane protein